MKKKLITILITSIIMIAAAGAFLWKMNDLSNKMEKQDMRELLGRKRTGYNPAVYVRRQ